MSKGLSESEFYMWRTLFAIAHADHVVTSEEVRFMAEALEDIPFSQEQHDILNDDITNPKDILEMFDGISDVHDQARFFKFARRLVWIDGDYGMEEQAIMLKLEEAHLARVNIVDDLVGSIKMEFEEDAPVSSSAAQDDDNRARGWAYALRRMVFGDD